MANNKEHSIENYDMLLQKYIEGRLSQEQQFLLEKRALDDPFLAEAIEGYKNTKTNTVDNLSGIIDNLRIRNKRNKNSYQIPYLKVTSIAASLILFAVISYFVVRDKEDNPSFVEATDHSAVEQENQSDIFVMKEEVANNILDKNKEAVSKSDINDGLISNVENTKNIKSNQKTISKPQIIKEKIFDKAETIEIPKNKVEIESDQSHYPPKLEIEQEMSNFFIDGVRLKGSKNPQIIESNSALSTIKKMDKIQNELLENNSGAGMVGKIESDKRPLNINGQVIDINNEGLISVTISNINWEEKLLSDLNGDFMFRVDTFPIELVFSYAGYEDKLLLVEDTNHLIVTMNELLQLADVVVSSYGLNVQGVPVIGIDNFLVFVENNKWMSDSDRIDMRGSVEVGFTITKDGDVMNIKILTSDCKVCNDRAIWLINESGKWVNSSIEEREQQYLIKF